MQHDIEMPAASPRGLNPSMMSIPSLRAKTETKRETGSGADLEEGRLLLHITIIIIVVVVRSALGKPLAKARPIPSYLILTSNTRVGLVCLHRSVFNFFPLSSMDVLYVPPGWMDLHHVGRKETRLARHRTIQTELSFATTMMNEHVYDALHF